MLFAIRSVLISKKSFIGSLSIIKNLKTKIKSHGDKVADFYDKEIPKMHSNNTCLAVISLDSALKNYYPQVFLKESKCIQKKVNRYINDKLSGFSSSDYSDHFNKE